MFLMQRTYSSLSSKIIHCSFSSQEFDPVTVQWLQICVLYDNTHIWIRVTLTAKERSPIRSCPCQVFTCDLQSPGQYVSLLWDVHTSLVIIMHIYKMVHRWSLFLANEILSSTKRRQHEYTHTHTVTLNIKETCFCILIEFLYQSLLLQVF